MIYKLKHPDPQKEGVLAGVDFIGGQGTTSSLQDAADLRDRFGCALSAIVDGVEKPIRVVEDRFTMKIPNFKQPIPTGPIVLRAEIVEEKQPDAGGASAPPVSILPEVEISPAPAPVKRERPGRKPGKKA
jgi:hypothetical protein